MDTELNVKTPDAERRVRDLYLAPLAADGSPHIVAVDNSYWKRTDKWHRHCDFYELVLVTGGSACSEHESGCHWYKPGAVQVFQPGSKHRYRAMRDFHHFNLLFSPRLLQGSDWDFSLFPAAGDLLFSPKKISGMYFLGDHDFAAAAELMTRLREELLRKSPGWREAAFFEFGMMMTFLLRRLQPAQHRVRSGAIMIESAIRFMEENLDQRLDLSDMARIANMSKSNFRHKFIAMTGFSPVEHLIRLRLKRALLLFAGREPLPEVARKTGFSDTNYFGRQFKRRLKLTPRELIRKTASGNIDIGGMMDDLLTPPEK